MKLEKAKFHFVGIGGIGMCGLAELLHNIGAQVSGSDISENVHTERLKEMGVKVYKGHQASNVGNADVVVYSTAIQYGNPEIAAAKAKGIPLMPRAEALAEIMRLKRGIAVAGTHGKTTTTSMTSAILLSANLSPTIFVGGRFELIKSTALLGDGEWFVAEADESDGSFHKLSPEISIITNIDSDHLDHFKTFENLQKSFLDFAYRIPFYGLCIVCGDDPLIGSIFENFQKRILFYGFDDKNDLVLKGEQGKYRLYRNHRLENRKELLGSFEVKVPGQHNALNATAAIAAGMAVGLSFEECAKGLATYEGVDRRFHFKGEKNKIKVYDDYGHHPTEVRATLQAFREKFPDQRIVVYFQPHRYSRTEQCWHDFTLAFSQGDVILITDIYAAGEVPVPGITGERLALETKHKNVHYLPKDDQAVSSVLKILQAGDVFVTLGAGDGWKLGMEVLEKIK